MVGVSHAKMKERDKVWVTCLMKEHLLSITCGVDRPRAFSGSLLSEMLTSQCTD